jgi:uroporphyrinogen decarboxylase
MGMIFHHLAHVFNHKPGLVDTLPPMAKLTNDTFIRALLREPTEYTPIWIMRQAGRYLPEYNETRKRAGDFLSLCKNPDFATEVTLQPLTRYPLDAAILFSDILTIPDAMGLGLYFETGEGPKFERPLREEWAIRDLVAPDPLEHLGYVLRAVAQIRKALDGSVPLIGFSGSPFTLACYMIEGGGSHDFANVKSMLYQRPDLLRHILEVNTRAVTDYLNAQIEAGAQAVMVFDTWGGMLAADAFKEFSCQYLTKIVAGLIRKREGSRIPCTLFTKGGGLWLETLADTGCDALGLDWTIDIGDARRRVGNRVALQGNLDPAILCTTPEVVRREAGRVLRSFGEGSGHVFNLGHGVSQFANPDNVAELVDAVHTLSRPMHTREAQRPVTA